MNAWTPTESQVTYVTKLVNERIEESELGQWFYSLRQVDSNADLDRAIKKLLSITPLAHRGLPNIEEARYALQDAEGVWKFYKVDRPQDGKWAGHTFLKLQVSDDYMKVQNRQVKDAVLAEIASNAEKAAADYGHQLGRCFKCHKALTNEVSIERGMGPKCASKVGW